MRQGITAAGIAVCFVPGIKDRDPTDVIFLPVTCLTLTLTLSLQTEGAMHTSLKKKQGEIYFGLLTYNKSRYPLLSLVHDYLHFYYQTTFLHPHFYPSYLTLFASTALEQEVHFVCGA